MGEFKNLAGAFRSGAGPPALLLTQFISAYLQLIDKNSLRNYLNLRINKVCRPERYSPTTYMQALPLVV